MKIHFTLFWLLLVIPCFAKALPQASFVDFSLNQAESNHAFYGALGHVFEAIPTDGSSLGIWNIDLEYHSKLNADNELIWNPLPLGILYHLDNSPSFKSAVSWNLGITNYYGLALKPRFDSFARWIISPVNAIEVHLEYFSAIPLRDHASAGTVGITAGWRSYLLTDFYVVPELQIILNDLVFRKLIADAPGEYKSVDPRLTIPVGLSLGYQASNSTKVGFEYLFRGIGITSDNYIYTAQLFTSLEW